MRKRLTVVYWKSERFWLGKLLEYPEIMTQGETLEELEENLKDAYRLMVLDEVALDYHTKEISVYRLALRPGPATLLRALRDEASQWHVAPELPVPVGQLSPRLTGPCTLKGA